MPKTLAEFQHMKYNKDSSKFELRNNKSFNYIQNDGRRIKFYNKIAVVYLKDTNEVNTVMKQNKVKEKWYAINNE